MALEKYLKKRNLELSGEPEAKEVKDSQKNVFVIHKHAASHLHFDLRLSDGHVLKSWAVPKGIPLKKNEKHFAKHVEDHPFDYQYFEGNIPEGNYGAGTVMIFDKGNYQGDLEAGLKKGHILFELSGIKIRGKFSLVNLKADDWILISHQDIDQIKDTLGDVSVATERTMAEIYLNKKINFKKIKDTPITDKFDTRPMLATPGSPPFSSKNYLFEAKLDGYRAISQVNFGAVKITSRNNLSFDEKFKAIHNDLKKLKYNAVFDGEIVSLNERGKPNFEDLQNVRSQDNRLYYYVFDLLYFENHDLRNLPLINRKELLQQLIPDNLKIRFLGHVLEQGEKYFEKIKNEDIEGLIAKQIKSAYKSAIRSPLWLKIKNIPISEFIIIGYTQPKGSRGHFGSLVLAKPDNGKLKFSGYVGTGFDDKAMLEMYEELQKLKTDQPIFKDIKNVTWVKPELKVRVKFLEETSSGQLRHPSFVSIDSGKTESKIFTPLNPKERILEIDNQKIKISNFDKIFFPELGLTKMDLINYYLKISKYILPYLYLRPESMHRFPNGINGKSFFHKDSDFKEKWIKTVEIPSDQERAKTNYMLITNTASLIYMINLGCIELNPWLSKAPNVYNPDILVFDIDPGDKATFEQAVQTALAIKKYFDQLKTKVYIKTSGASGLHIFLPIEPDASFETTKLFAELIANLVATELNIVSLERNPNKRIDKVYIDFLQNNFGQTIASVYSIRPNKNALVSTPVSWSNLTKIKPEDFNYQSVFNNLDSDPWKDFFNQSYKINELLEKTKKLIKS